MKHGAMVRRCDGATVRATVRGCGGVPRRSRGAAKAAATVHAVVGATVLACVLLACSAETVGPVAVQSTPLKFDSGRAYEDLRRQVGFGPRPAGSAALAQCRQYILAQLKNAGIEAREDAWDADTPLGRVRMVNVVATIPGRRADRIALATHYDTKLFNEFRFVEQLGVVVSS